EGKARDLEASLAGLRLEPERSRIERLELERDGLVRSADAERVAHRAERRLLEAHANQEREAKRAQEHLVEVQERLFEVQLGAERAQVEAERAAERMLAQLEELKVDYEEASRAARADRTERDELRLRLSAVEAESEARRRALDAIHSTRAFRWVQRWWRLARRLRSPRKSSPRPEASVSPARSPVKDGL
ncbi:MAG: hypothetical protein AAFX50_11650, partial [Acidobacteriota bacterium]